MLAFGLVLLNLLELQLSLNVDVCAHLYATDFADRFEISGPPVCDFNDVCSGISRRENPYMSISCDEAFRMNIEQQTLRIDDPPIFSKISPRTHNLYLGREIEYLVSAHTVDDETVYLGLLQVEARAILSELEVISNAIIARIFVAFPRLVYSEVIDGPLLRSFTENFHSLAQLRHPPALGKIDNLTWFVMRSNWMRKLAWSVSMMMWHVAAQPIRETELHVGAMVPWLHAFLKSSFELEIVYPDQFGDYSWLLRFAAEFDPLYTTDRVWYILADSTMTHENEVFVHRHGNLTWDMVQDVFFGLPIVHDGPEIARALVTQFTKLSDLSDTADTATFNPIGISIAKIVYAIEYLWTFESVHFASLVSEPQRQKICEHLNGDTQTNVFIGPVAIGSLIRVFKPLLSLSDKAKLLASLETVAAQVPMNLQSKSHDILVPYNGSSQIDLNQFVSNLLQFDKQEFSIEVYLSITSDRPLIDTYGDMMDAFVSPQVGLFDLVDNEELFGEESRLYRLNESFSRTNPLIQIAFGRLIALIITLYNPGNVLNRYIIPPTPASSVFDTLFFGSRFIQQGVYDLYLHGSFETSFQNGQELCSALASLTST